MEDLSQQILQSQIDYQQTAQKFWKLGYAEALEKVEALSSLWAKKELSDNDFAIKLNELIQNGKK